MNFVRAFLVFAFFANSVSAAIPTDPMDRRIFLGQVADSYRVSPPYGQPVQFFFFRQDLFSTYLFQQWVLEALDVTGISRTDRRIDFTEPEMVRRLEKVVPPILQRMLEYYYPNSENLPRPFFRSNAVFDGGSIESVFRQTRGRVYRNSIRYYRDFRSHKDLEHARDAYRSLKNQGTAIYPLLAKILSQYLRAHRDQEGSREVLLQRGLLNKQSIEKLKEAVTEILILHEEPLLPKPPLPSVELETSYQQLSSLLPVLDLTKTPFTAEVIFFGKELDRFLPLVAEEIAIAKDKILPLLTRKINDPNSNLIEVSSEAIQQVAISFEISKLLVQKYAECAEKLSLLLSGEEQKDLHGFVARRLQELRSAQKVAEQLREEVQITFSLMNDGISMFRAAQLEQVLLKACGTSTK